VWERTGLGGLFPKNNFIFGNLMFPEITID